MLQFQLIFMTNQSIGVKILPIPASSPPAFLVQPASQQPVSLQETVPPKLGFEKSKSAQVTYSQKDSLLTLGSFSILYCKWKRPQGKDLFHLKKTTKSRTLPQGTVYVKKMAGNQNPAWQCFNEAPGKRIGAIGARFDIHPIGRKWGNIGG